MCPAWVLSLSKSSLARNPFCLPLVICTAQQWNAMQILKDVLSPVAKSVSPARSTGQWIQPWATAPGLQADLFLIKTLEIWANATFVIFLETNQNLIQEKATRIAIFLLSPTTNNYVQTKREVTNPSQCKQ